MFPVLPTADRSLHAALSNFDKPKTELQPCGLAHASEMRQVFPKDPYSHSHHSTPFFLFPAPRRMPAFVFPALPDQSVNGVT